MVGQGGVGSEELVSTTGKVVGVNVGVDGDVATCRGQRMFAQVGCGSGKWER